MCTAIAYKTNDFYFGRNLDSEISYNGNIVITPRKYRFKFRKQKALKEHFAIIGMAIVEQDYPLYFDATNEKGLSMAGLNFSKNAVYNPLKCDKDNIASFELIPFILGQCACVSQAEKLLESINIADIPFSEKYPPTELHWMISDKEKSVTLEQTKEGLFVFENKIGVLTNNPQFPIQMLNLSNFMGISAGEPENRFSKQLPIDIYSRGMGAIGLPGDLTSASRFVRAAFTKLNSVAADSEEASVSQFFHILNSVSQTRGCAKVGKAFEITDYSSCCNTDKGIYYYTTYKNSQISAVDMTNENLDSKDLIIYKLINNQQINFQN